MNSPFILLPISHFLIAHRLMRTQIVISIFILMSALVAGPSFMSAQKIIIGTIKSAQSKAVKDAEVYIYDTPGTTLLGSSATDALGKFRSDPDFRAAQKVRIKIMAAGYEDLQLSHTVGNAASGSNIGPVMLQSLISIEGIIRSDQGVAIPAVTVSFLDVNGQLVGAPAVSDVNGKYKSEKQFKKGETITAVAQKKGFSEGRAVQAIGNVPTGAINIPFTLKTVITISGFVTDSITPSDQLSDVDISFYDRDTRLISRVTTNQQGYYDFDADGFMFGDVIKVRAEKKGYCSKDATLPIGRNENRLDIRLAKPEDRGIRVNIRVYGKKRKPLEGAIISYQDRRNRITMPGTPASGEVSPLIYQKSGTLLDLRVLKGHYREGVKKHTLIDPAIGANNVEIFMERAGSPCPCFLYGGLAAAGAGTFMYIKAFQSHDAYTDYKNLDRESDNSRSNKQLRTGHITMGVAALAITGFVICKSKEKQHAKDEDRRRTHSSLVPLLQKDTYSRSTQFGIAFQF